MNNTSNGLPLPDPCVKMQLSHRLFHGIASSFELELGTVPETNYGHSHRLHSHWLSNFRCQPLHYLINIRVIIIIIFKVKMHLFQFVTLFRSFHNLSIDKSVCGFMSVKPLLLSDFITLNISSPDLSSLTAPEAQVLQAVLQYIPPTPSIKHHYRSSFQNCGFRMC